MKIYISANSSALSALNLDATVEAEYGDTVVIGSILTLAHHGQRSGRPCPCSFMNFPKLGIESVGVSHVDLDTIGGIMSLMGTKPFQNNWVQEFWRVAAEIDVKGVHKLHEIPLGGVAEDYILDSLNAWWAFSESPEGRVFAPRDGSATEVDLSHHFEVIKKLLTPQEGEEWYDEPQWDNPARLALIEAGRAWAAAKARLDEESLVEDLGNVLLRSSDQFTNHLYRAAKSVVSFNTKTKSVTVSLSDPVKGVSCREVVQTLWGTEAGGHDGIAGSPRGKEMSFDDAVAAASVIMASLYMVTD